MLITIDKLITLLLIVFILFVLIRLSINLFLKKEKTLKIKIILQSIRLILLSVFIKSLFGVIWYAHGDIKIPGEYCEWCEKSSQNSSSMFISLTLYIITVIISIIVHKASKNEVLSQNENIKETK